MRYSASDIRVFRCYRPLRLITRWFDAATRPVAVSFTTTGLSLGGVIMTPLSTLLFAKWSLEQAMLILAAVFAFVNHAHRVVRRAFVSRGEPSGHPIAEPFGDGIRQRGEIAVFHRA